MTKKVLIIMAEKSETVEIVVPADILGKIDGIEVTIASVHGKDEVRTSSDIVITPDVGLAQVDEDGFDAIVIPGGFGYKILEKSELVGKILKNHYSKGKIVAAICFGPVVFLSHAIGLGNRITSYPGVEQEFREKYEYLEDPVVQDKNMITSRGPAFVYLFAFKIAENLVSLDKVKQRAEKNLFHDLYK